MREDAQGLLFALLDELHAGVVLPRAERILGLLRCVVVLLVHEGAGVGDDAAEVIGAEPAHRERRSAAGAAPHDGVTPRVFREGEPGIGGFDVGVGDHGGDHFLGDEACEAVGHRVVFEAALAVLAVVAAVFHGDGDEGGQLAVRVLGDGEVVERVAHGLQRAGAVVDDEQGSRGAVLVGRRNIDGDFALRAHGLLVGFERLVVAAEDLAVGERHLELEGFPLGSAEVGEVLVGGVLGADGEFAVAFRAGTFGECVDGAGGVGRETDDGDE